jgi:hypothetical protein
MRQSNNRRKTSNLKMIFTLTMLICSNYNIDCAWREIGVFHNERNCVMAALMVYPLNPQFKCNPEIIPLPRPRPRG